MLSKLHDTCRSEAVGSYVTERKGKCIHISAARHLSGGISPRFLQCLRAEPDRVHLFAYVAPRSQLCIEQALGESLIIDRVDWTIFKIIIVPILSENWIYRVILW